MNQDVDDKKLDGQKVDEQKIAELVARAMDRQVAGQDAATRARLALMRREALRQGSRWRPFFWLGGIGNWGFGGAALATAMSFSALMFIDTPIPDSSPSAGHSSIELAVLNDDAELYTDLDFYYWLEQQEESREL